MVRMDCRNSRQNEHLASFEYDSVALIDIYDSFLDVQGKEEGEILQATSKPAAVAFYQTE